MSKNNKDDNMTDPLRYSGRQDKISKGAKQKKSSIVAGVVVNDKMKKTVIIRVDSVTHHPVYKKVMRRARKNKGS